MDTGEEGGDGFGQENGGSGPAGSGVPVAVPNGDAGTNRYDEIPEGDVAVLNNHRSEVRFERVIEVVMAVEIIVGCMRLDG